MMPSMPPSPEIFNLDDLLGPPRQQCHLPPDVARIADYKRQKAFGKDESDEEDDGREEELCAGMPPTDDEKLDVAKYYLEKWTRAEEEE